MYIDRAGGRVENPNYVLKLIKILKIFVTPDTVKSTQPYLNNRNGCPYSCENPTTVFTFNHVEKIDYHT